MMPEIMVINLDRSPERLAFMRGQLKRLGLPFTRLPATDATEIADADFERLGRTYMRPVSRSELACLYSHTRAWRHAADANRPVLVLEDDMALSEKLPLFLQNFVPDEAFGLVNIETRRKAKRVSRGTHSTTPACGVSLYELYIDRGGSGGYIVLPKTVRTLLERAKNYAAPSDSFLDLSGVPRLQTEPGLATPAFAAANARSGANSVFKSTIRVPSRSSRLGLMVRQPHFKLRRLAGYFGLARRKLASARTGVRRTILPCPTILDKLSNGSA